EQLAAVDPDYRLAQVKEKYGQLRYYLETTLQPPCCLAWDAAHPLAKDANEATERAWDAAAEAHDTSVEHRAALTNRDAIDVQMEALIAVAEAASYGW